MKQNALIEEIDAILPQTQCRRCGFSGCLPYAEAIAEGRADINQCPPGGDEGIRRLAELLGKRPPPLNHAHGSHQPQIVALINEEACIGCTLCIQACPVDAIVGATKQMHTVIAAECTGCELCIAPCPMDCISMMPRERFGRGAGNQFDNTDDGSRRDGKAAADHARKRYRYRLQRLEREKRENEARMAQEPEAVTVTNSPSVAGDRKKAAIQAALSRATAERARATRTQGPTKT
ncbi:electron transport complex subunit RsxB [Nitrosospira sp. Is2]|uniref:electron transport complex subunit RsxB n=1 Tax=Nitrosospira sp. Is2 TaxID=3080532 RepID=UPI0029558AF2|nr:electron transport complex subunit RsxB [Nitrosospira sp. Is2]WON75209.1 electron transport complex subunit RsxB [Nitrosospira sp. Is2]